MTAIIAYAKSGYAFVAADTKRSHPAFPTAVTKVHSWSQNIVFGHAGNADQLPRLIYQMLEFRGSMMVGDDLNGFYHAFENLYSNYAKAAATAAEVNPKVDQNGTILVADAISGKVYKIDFQTGNCESTNVGNFETAGDPSIAEIATSSWKKGRIDLDQWSCDSIGHLCTSISITGVDWPIDMLISRPVKHAGQVIIAARRDEAKRGSSYLFKLPHRMSLEHNMLFLRQKFERWWQKILNRGGRLLSRDLK